MADPPMRCSDLNFFFVGDQQDTSTDPIISKLIPIGQRIPTLRIVLHYKIDFLPQCIFILRTSSSHADVFLAKPTDRWKRIRENVVTVVLESRNVAFEG